jgi:predicted transposase YbfD/YdcC
MQSTVSQPPPATRAAAGALPARPVVVAPGGLVAAFAAIPDPRRRQGIRFPLAGLLALAVAAILSNHLSVLAIAEWGADQSPGLLRALGLPAGVSPHQSTLQRLFRQLAPAPLAAALGRYVGAPAAGDEPVRGGAGVAVDGKAQRGRLAFERAGCPVHALSAVCHARGVVLGALPIEAGADKAAAELTVAPALVAQLDWRGRVLTGDALFCQRPLCQQVLDAGGDDLLLVKENQPTLLGDIRLLFDPPAPALPLADRREARTVEHGHGRHHDTRHLTASTDLLGYSDWPGLAQVFRLERTWWEHATSHRVVQYGITSLPPGFADPARLLALKRGHWQIENGLHRVKDVALAEDTSSVHLGRGPAVLAALRDCAVSLLHEAACRTIATRLRYLSRHPEAALALLTAPTALNA